MTAERTALEGLLSPQAHPSAAEEMQIPRLEDALDMATRELRRAQPAW